jgi:nicotinamide-nucleotide amidase
MLLEGSITLSAAESCTGGLFASQITEIPGISRIFNRGLVTYSNQSKIDELSVSNETLEHYGAVSPETAREMAQGLYNKTGSDLCISVTGIAGPEGGTPEKPVGLVFIAVLYGGQIYERRVQSRNVNRNWNRNYTVLSMLNFIRQILLNCH